MLRNILIAFAAVGMGAEAAHQCGFVRSGHVQVSAGPVMFQAPVPQAYINQWSCYTSETQVRESVHFQQLVQDTVSNIHTGDFAHLVQDSQVYVTAYDQARREVALKSSQLQNVFAVAAGNSYELFGKVPAGINFVIEAKKKPEPKKQVVRLLEFPVVNVVLEAEFRQRKADVQINIAKELSALFLKEYEQRVRNEAKEQINMLQALLVKEQKAEAKKKEAKKKAQFQLIWETLVFEKPVNGLLIAELPKPKRKEPGFVLVDIDAWFNKQGVKVVAPSKTEAKWIEEQMEEVERKRAAINNIRAMNWLHPVEKEVIIRDYATMEFPKPAPKKQQVILFPFLQVPIKHEARVAVERRIAELEIMSETIYSYGMTRYEIQALAEMYVYRHMQTVRYTTIEQYYSAIDARSLESFVIQHYHDIHRAQQLAYEQEMRRREAAEWDRVLRVARDAERREAQIAQDRALAQQYQRAEEQAWWYQEELRAAQQWEAQQRDMLPNPYEQEWLNHQIDQAEIQRQQLAEFEEWVRYEEQREREHQQRAARQPRLRASAPAFVPAAQRAAAPAPAHQPLHDDMWDIERPIYEDVDAAYRKELEQSLRVELQNVESEERACDIFEKIIRKIENRELFEAELEPEFRRMINKYRRKVEEDIRMAMNAF